MATARMAGTARPPNCRRTNNTLAPIAYFAIDRGEAPTHLTSCSAFRGPGACQGLIASDETRLLPDHLTWWRLAATQDDIAEILADWSERRWCALQPSTSVSGRSEPADRSSCQRPSLSSYEMSVNSLGEDLFVRCALRCSAGRVMRRERFGEHVTHLIGPSPVMFDDLVGDPGHPSLLNAPPSPVGRSRRVVS